MIIASIRLLGSHARRQPLALKSSCARRFSLSVQRSMDYNIREPIEEELLPGNRLKYFHQTHPGDVLDGRFKTISKLGYGSGSTVWLAENLDITNEEEGLRFVSIKIPALDTDTSRELNVAQAINQPRSSNADGLSFIRVPFHEFKIEGTEGTHTCLVYEPMRETLFSLQRRMKRQRFEPSLFKFYAYCLLMGLDYLHSECRIIHTDIKDDNIMVTFENDQVLADYVRYHTTHPQPRHTRSDDKRVIYLSQDNFGPLQGARLLPELGDFNLAFPGLEEEGGHLSVIQSHRYRAPEVLLGCPWSYSADIWNFGLLMWNLLEDTSLFGRPAGHDGEYNAHVHLAQMIALLGDPPKELIERERTCRRVKLKDSITNPSGKVCSNTNEYFGGPFFDENNKPICADPIATGPALADTVTEITGDEKEAFLDLASNMLQWLPEKRMTAKQLLQHPYFAELREDRERHG